MLIFLVATSTIVEKPADSGTQNTFETDVTNDEKVVEQATDSFDSFFKDFEAEENESDKCHSTATETVQQTVQPLVQSPNTKQSLFIRLANRIKVTLIFKIYNFPFTSLIFYRI